MSKYVIEKKGCCNAYVLHYITVEGTDRENALENYYNTGEYLDIESSFEIEDDYSETTSITKYD